MHKPRSTDLQPSTSAELPSAGAEANRAELTGQIRFALSELAARNGHHEFEHLCRHLARQRIASNLLPATGPVGAGGDQGRDFQTYRSFLRRELGDNSAFLGLVSEGPLVFACTLQRESVPAKVRADLKVILGDGMRPAAIYYFAAASIPVGTRHKLQRHARRDHGIELIIFDGFAISEELAERDALWIAEQFLTLPASVTAGTEEEQGVPEWYGTDRRKWAERGTARGIPADVVDLKDGLRHATLYREARGDLPFWLDLMRKAEADEQGLAQARQRARYEIVLATVRAVGELTPADEMVRSFFAEMPVDHGPIPFEDASVILSHVSSAVMAGATSISANEFHGWSRALARQLKELAANEESPNRRAAYLETLGILGTQLDPDAFEPPSEPRTLPDAADLVGPDGSLVSNTRPRPQDTEVMVDVDKAMTAWTELVQALPEAPLFPVERFSKILGLLSPALVDRDGWRELVDGVDAAVANSAGAAAAAGSARDRALALRRAGRVRAAVHEIHSAIVDWWSGDTLRGSLLAMVLVADCYRELNLPQAARQYALAAAGAADAHGGDELSDLIPAAWLQASEIDYAAGMWCSALFLADFGLRGQDLLIDVDASERAQNQQSRAMFTIGMCLSAARVCLPNMVPAVEEIADRHQMLDAINDVLAEAEPMSASEWIARADEQLLGRPFSDIGPKRVIRFAALGTRWTIQTKNEYLHGLAAERFAAAAQILMVELADEDLCLLATEIEVKVLLLSDDLPDDVVPVRDMPSNEGRKWLVGLTPAVEGGHLDPEATSKELLAALSIILSEACLTPPKAFLEAVERAFKRGLGAKLTAGRPYDDMAQVMRRDAFEELQRSAYPPAGPSETPFHESPELPWPDGPGPGYSVEEARKLISHRYQELAKRIPRTLDMLRQDGGFAEVVAELRAEGWLDWHIVLAALNIAINFRLETLELNTGEAFTDPDKQRLVERSQKRPEDGEPALAPRERFSLAGMRSARDFSLLATVQVWGLEAGQRTPDMPAIENLLAARYGYWSDDVPHEPLFEPVAGDKSSY